MTTDIDVSKFMLLCAMGKMLGNVDGAEND